MDRVFEILCTNNRLRWDMQERRFALVVDSSPALKIHVSKQAAASNPLRYLSAATIAGVMNQTQTELIAAVLRAALIPFAAVADQYDDAEDDAFEIWKDRHVPQTIITLGQCRTAQQALAAEERANANVEPGMRTQFAAMRAALKHIASIADQYSEHEDDRHELWEDPHMRETIITLAHCRAARAALNPSGAMALVLTSTERNNCLEEAVAALYAAGKTALSTQLRSAWAAEQTSAATELGLVKLSVEQIKSRLASADALIEELQASERTALSPCISDEDDHAAFERSFSLINDYTPLRLENGEYENLHEREAWTRWQNHHSPTTPTPGSSM